MQAKFSEVYNSVYKYKGEDWKRVSNCVVIVINYFNSDEITRRNIITF